jgi:hypothetical protein
MKRLFASKAAVAGIVAIAVMFGTAVQAQTVVTGHYQPLFASGLKSGILPTRPGLIYQNSTLFYHTTSFRDDNGNEVGGVDELNIWANRNTLLWVSGQKILGADYAAAVAVPVANLAPNPVVVGGQTLETGVGFTDIAALPVLLGWHWTDFHVQSGYTVFLPVGKFTWGPATTRAKGSGRTCSTWGARGCPPARGPGTCRSCRATRSIRTRKVGTCGPGTR